MAENKTQATKTGVIDFLNGVEPAQRRDDALRLDTIFREVTGFQPVIWGPSIVGYGRYRYVYASGREGDSLATGFSARKANLSIYIMPGYADFVDILARLGKHKTGKSCLYIDKLDDIGENALREVIRAGLKDLATRWQAQPS